MPIYGPRNSVTRVLLGEDVSFEEWAADTSEFVDGESLYFNELSELWVDKVHDYVGGE